MLDLSKTILSDYQVRKTAKQKLAFIELLKRHYPTLRVEEGGLGHNRNIIIGDVSQAKVIMAAHYDTCAVLPFPNLIMPKNILFTLLYSLLITLPFLAVGVIAEMAVAVLTDSFWISYFTFFVSFLGSYVGVFMFGIPNKHTANDNTSGVITLIELMATFSDTEKEKLAFVFFDNEENGLLGSAYFRSLHKRELHDKLLINFDCVSDGDYCLILPNKSVMKKHGDALKQSFVDSASKKVSLSKDSTTFYPSDQMGFPNNIAVAFLNKNRILGLYMNKIHTSRDRVFDESNIEYICTCMKHFVGELLTE